MNSNCKIWKADKKMFAPGLYVLDLGAGEPSILHFFGRAISIDDLFVNKRLQRFPQKNNGRSFRHIG
jgi:hypothetical protein